MGQIVVVRSDVKNSGKSVFTYIAANFLNEMVSKDKKVLVCCLNFRFSILYKLFGIDVSALGMGELINYQCLNTSGGTEVIRDIIPRSKGIYFLGSYRTTNSFAQKNDKKYVELLDKLQSSFDLIIFDTVSSTENILTNMVLKKADMILNLFVQDVESIKGLSAIIENRISIKQENIFVISKYRDIYPRVSDIKRVYSIKNIFTIDYCKTLQEMKNRESLHHYIQRDTSCNKSIRLISKYILDVLKLSRDSELEEKGSGHMRGLFNNLFMANKV
jgi:cellulose biosynthesis protein BcsQ